MLGWSAASEGLSEHPFHVNVPHEPRLWSSRNARLVRFVMEVEDQGNRVDALETLASAHFAVHGVHGYGDLALWRLSEQTCGASLADDVSRSVRYDSHPELRQCRLQEPWLHNGQRQSVDKGGGLHRKGNVR